MRGRLKLGGQALAIAAVSVLLGILVWRLTHQAHPPKAGGRAPTFSLKRLNGHGTLALASLRGKAVVLNFWASWCAPCKAEAPALERLWHRYRSRGVVIVGIDSNDAASDARRFVAAHGITYPVVSDPNALVAANSYDVANLPATYFVDRRGRLVSASVLGPVTEHERRFQQLLETAMRS